MQAERAAFLELSILLAATCHLVAGLATLVTLLAAVCGLLACAGDEFTSSYLGGGRAITGVTIIATRLHEDSTAVERGKVGSKDVFSSDWRISLPWPRSVVNGNACWKQAFARASTDGVNYEM